MACLDPNLVQALESTAVDSGERAEALAHAADCDDCRMLLAAVVRRGPALGPPLQAGDRVGRYVVTELLGAGGMGVVFAAEDPELHRAVAIKVLRRAAAGGSSEGQARLLREAQAMARVSHPNVIAVYDVGTVDGEVFVAMERVDGGNLRQWLRARPRARREIVDMFLGAARGLAAAHAAGMVHRDFKPDNVLVGTDGRPRVTDFGLARAEGELPFGPGDVSSTGGAGGAPRLLDSPLTRSGALMGTPAYMAPEQHAGAHTDPRTDQFSYCVALWEALHGDRPFDERSWEALRAAAAAGRVREVARAAARQVTSSQRRILLRGLSARPGDRFATMDELIEALSRDRTRLARAVARVSLALLASVLVALGADWLARERAVAVARASFAAGRDQLGRALAMRYEAFVAMSDLSYVVPVMRGVASGRDESDFGLGGADTDQAGLADLHENLRGADWTTWAAATRRGAVAVADCKGRLVYSSAAKDQLGTDVRVLAAVAQAYDPVGAGAMVVRGDAPELAAIGRAPARGGGLVVLFARGVVIGGKTRAVFIQLLDGARLLEEVSLGEGTELALVAPDGSAQGTVPAGVIARARSVAEGAGPREVASAGSRWLVLRHPLVALDQRSHIASIVLARRMDVGLAGLFAGARPILAALAVALLVAAGLGTALASRLR